MQLELTQPSPYVMKNNGKTENYSFQTDSAQIQNEKEE